MTRQLLLGALLVPFLAAPSFAQDARTAQQQYRSERAPVVRAVPMSDADLYGPRETHGQRVCTYYGGPKSELWACRTETE